MLLRHAVRAAAGLVLATCLAGEAYAWQIGNWIGRPMYSNNGFAGCRMSVRYNSGITLHFLQLRNYVLFIGMSKPEWSMNPNGHYNMGLVIDGRYIRRARGVVLAGLTNAIFLNLGQDRVTRDLLARRFHLTLVNNQQNYNFQLTATAAALERLEYCVRAGG
ncbi:MAG: hypothetical protein KIT16_08285 [Rhodospirillaceae bacterium]|nr:hypothetical protein [Rhodospirillaceae bacterium]